MSTFNFDIHPQRFSDLKRSDIRSGRWVPFVPGIYVPRGCSVNRIGAARALHLRYPTATIGGYAALLFHGVPFWGDSAIALGHVVSNHARVDPHFRLLRGTEFSPFSGLDPAYPELTCTDVATATVDCLVDLAKEREQWWTTIIPGMSLPDVRCIHIIDAARNYAGLTNTQLRKAARHRFDRCRLSRLLKHSIPNSGSPQETTLRLLLTQIFPGLVCQHEVWNGSKLVTVIDFAWPMLKVAIYYDGHHHNIVSTANRDKEIDAYLQENGWRVLRVTKSMVTPERRDQLLWRVGKLIALAHKI